MTPINQTFRFNVGGCECLVIRDSISPMELEFLFARTPPAQLKQWLEEYHVAPGEVMDVMCLLLRTAGHTILVDTGWGAGDQPDTGKLLDNLRRQKIRPEEIDAVIISHCHPDHIGGITGAGGRLVFPRARYFMGKIGWDFWTSGPDLSGIDENIVRTMLGAVRKNLLPIKDRLTLVEGDAEILPGIEYIRAPGHSPDHGVLVISSGGEQLLYSADLVHHPLQLACPDLCTAMDLATGQALETRTRIIRRAVKDGMTVFACHFPFPGVGKIIPEGGRSSWQPAGAPV
jgi:glyoxylase-like metal-dependent hydrolase (beta-lactamase superfamily II)